MSNRGVTDWKLLKRLVDRKLINGNFDVQHVLGVHIYTENINLLTY